MDVSSRSQPLVQYGHSLVRRREGELLEHLYCEACGTAFLSEASLSGREEYCSR